MQKLYACMGGYVLSATDSDEHYISARDLPSLYRVNPNQCIFIDSEQDSRGYNLNNYTVLTPRSSGDYRLT